MNKAPYHINGKLHVTGQTRFTLDENRPTGLLYMKILFSTEAHARIVSINTYEAQRIAGVRGIFTWKDIPGENQIGVVAKDEPLLPENEVIYVGQPVAVAVAESPEICNRALKAVEVRYSPLEAVFTIEEAAEKNLTLGKENKLQKGNPGEVWNTCPHIIEGTISGGGQEHLYLETQRVRVVPDEDRHFYVYSATQSPTEIQEICARILNLSAKDITVDVKRLGGAFGGKERNSTIYTALAALAAYKTGKPVEFEMERHDDIRFTGKRHAFETRYKVGFDDNGKLLAGDFSIRLNGGACTDLSPAILERAVWHMDNAYHFPHIKITGKTFRTNLPPNTAFRGFGGPQGIFSCEYAMERIAKFLKKDIFEIRALNAYRDGETTPYGQEVREVCFDEVFERLKTLSDYKALRKSCDEFNRNNKYKKRGIGITPVKFGISFTSAFLNQGAALIWVFTDGTVSVSHGGIEMGQELNTKIAQIVAKTLGVSQEKIKIESTNVKRVANTSPTAASSGTDLNGNAARLAAEKIKSRLIPVAKEMLTQRFGLSLNAEEVVFEADFAFAAGRPEKRIPFHEITETAYMNRINLGAQAYYKTPGIHFDREKGKGNPFYYFVTGAALTQAEIDVLTGAYKIQKAFIVHQSAKSINIAVDKGQVEGGYIQGMGWVTMEEIVINSKGENTTGTTSTYKIPSFDDLPGEFKVEMVEKKRKFASVYGSKAVGEPPFMYGISAFFALKDAVESVSGHTKEAELTAPATPEKVLLAVEKMYG